MENHILQMVGFSRCHLGFRVFFKLIVVMSCWGCPGSKPSSPERKEISWLLEKLPWRKFRMISWSVDPQGLDVEFFGFTSHRKHRKLTWKWKITFFKWLEFPVVISVFACFFFQMICCDCLVEVVLAPIHPVLKERMSSPVSSEIALAKVQDDIMYYLSRRMQERFEWIQNIFWNLTLILQDNTVICTSVIVKQHSFNWKAYVFENELENTKHWW